MTVEEFRGFPTQSLPGRSAAEIQAILAADREAIEKGERVDIPEIEVHLNSGRRGWQHMIKIPLRDGDGTVVGIVGLAEDITQRKQIEAALVDAMKHAENATRLKDKFVSLIAHDLRSPIGAVLGLLRHLEPGTDQPGESERQASYNKAVERLNGMIRLIDVVLDITRIQSGELHLNMQRCRAVDLTVPALGLRPLAESKGVVLVSQVPDSAEVMGDETYIGQVVQNLVSNAIKFSLPGGTVTIFIPEGRPTTIAVRDTGVGVAPHMLADLFKHDVKTTSLGTHGELGTGLGLPLCHDIMQAHRGRLYVESTIGAGSTFFAELPSEDTLPMALRPAREAS
jgi:PAS domain S-box-containing protein